MKSSASELRQDAGTTVLGRYRLGVVIGRGGMSTVHRGVDLATGAPVAIKLLAPHLSEDHESRRRLLAEARAISRLPHPNIVRLVDWGTAAAGSVVLVMELIDGETLYQRLSRGPLPAEEGVHVAQQVAQALAFAHRRGIIHRDVKPANILLGHPANGPTEPAPAGGPDDATRAVDALPVAKLADFGIARSADTTTYTATGLVMGSAPYLAPELLRGSPASPQSDLYALGVTLFQMLTGQLPFPSATAAESLTRRLMEDPPRLRLVLATAPAWLDEMVAALLAREPEERPPDAEGVAAALSRAEAPTRAMLPPWEWATVPVSEWLVRSTTRHTAPLRAAPVPPRRSTGGRRLSWPLLARVPDPEPLRAAALAALCAVLLLVAVGAVAAGTRHVTASAPETAQEAEVAPTAAPTMAPTTLPATATPAPTAVPTLAPTQLPTQAPPARPTIARTVPVVRAVPRSPASPRNEPAKGHSRKHGD